MNVLFGLRNLAVAGLILWPHWTRAWRPYRFREATAGNGCLKYIAELPVLCVRGRPEEIGRQKAELTARGAKLLADFPRALVALMGRQGEWSQLIATARQMLKQFPADHRRELEVCAEAAKVDRDKLLAVNTMLDVYGGFGCSSLVVEGNRSATGSPIFGRNLDIISLGILQRYGLVAVYRPQGKFAFASVCFPGVFGVFSGMNERGLALALHGVFRTDDDSATSDPKGIPCTMLLRRVLEECSTVEEAEQLLRTSQHTTLLNIVLCDRIRGAVAEVSPGGVALRRSMTGICACTNHFRAGRDLPAGLCRRYAGLLRDTEIGKLAVDAMAGKLHQVHQGLQTVQTIIFEPGPLHLHIAMGSCPSSALPLKQLRIGPLLGIQESPANSPA